MARETPIASANDVIAAPATAAGVGAVAIVRVSGAEALEISEKVFRGPLRAAHPGTLVLGNAAWPAGGVAIDRCLAVRWQGPRSFTGENLVELHLHGSPAIVRETMAALLSAGAREASPGEFTRRAFENGKLDLAQAEAVAELTRAQTEDAGRAALRQLAGGLSAELHRIRDGLVQLVAELEAYIDYPEEDIPAPDRSRQIAVVDECLARISALRETYRRGRLLAEGARVVLAGPPNAGKSSLFNALAGRERALVSPHPGTTRDTVEMMLDFRGIAVTLVDTAGLRTGAEPIEAMGIERTREELCAADLVIFVVDAAEGDQASAMAQYELLDGTPHLLVLNKTDLAGENDPRRLGPLFHNRDRRVVLPVSVARKTGLAALEEAIAATLVGGNESASPDIVTSARHFEALSAGAQSLAAARDGLADGIGGELVVLELTMAMTRVDSILGLSNRMDEDVLDAIFSTFCLGK